MKRILLTVSLLLASLTSAQALFANDPDAPSQAVPAEVSAVLLSPDYATLIAAQVQTARESGKELRIDHFSVLHLGDRTYAYVFLFQRVSANLGQWSPYGQLVADIQYGPLGESTVGSIYFKPAEDLPGGGSVGNM